MSKYNIQDIEKLRIHELRDFARTVGVSSPTTMKKDELISKINGLLIDGDNDSIKSFKHPKDDESIDFFSLLTSSDLNLFNGLLEGNKGKGANQGGSKTIIAKKKPVLATDSNVYFPTEEFIGFNLKLRQDFAEYGEGTDELRGGFVDIHPDGYGIVRFDGFVPSSSDIYITKPLVDKHNLKKGHFVFGKVRDILKNKPKVMFEIISIDDAKEVKKNLNKFEEYPFNGLGKTLYLDKFNLKVNKGSRIYIGSANLSDVVKLSYNIVEENAQSVKLINIKSRPEENYKSDQKLTIINCPFNQTSVEVVNTVELVSERVKREFEYTKSNVIIIYNFSELIRIFNSAVDGYIDYSKFNEKAIIRILNILYLAKHVNEKLNTTIICIDKNGIPDDMLPIMKGEYLQLFNEVYDTLK